MIVLRLIQQAQAMMATIQETGMGKIYEFIDFWDHCPKLDLCFQLDKVEHVITYALASQSFINYLDPGEKIGLYAGDMILISDIIAKDKPHWVPYIVLKLYLERFVDEGLDQSGKVKHFKTLFKTIQLAGILMSEDEMHEFLSFIITHERQGYFKTDPEVSEFIKKYGGSKEKMLEQKRRYLIRHHDNQWVGFGRKEENLVSMGIEIYNGFRNKAEVISIRLSESTSNIYLAAEFIRVLISADYKTPIILNPPFNEIAYILTRDCNSVADVIRFLPKGITERINQDAIVKIPKMQKTLVGISKRLSFKLHQMELITQKLIEDNRSKLNGLIAIAETANIDFKREIEFAKQIITTEGPFSKSIEDLRGRSAVFAKEIQRLSELSKQLTESLATLDEVANLLKIAI